ncbi:MULTISPECIES: hypothetical protein [Lactobacillaceae]|uniref:hypothetical protein n=1 Tax=Lactobacillaceae TaxID=33958 RepID=UPI0021A8A6EA|nr:MULTISPECIES: hypothetical protein [Lactobacillaceae]MCT3574552.1 hypothetical protein [Levilactobacillus brevis]MDH5112500.1 hypothetical protein [Lactiplantibacillus plantarum]UZF06959.1 hypothetical protein NYQ69_16300 [Lactiplantibacillus plantarum]
MNNLKIYKTKEVQYFICANAIIITLFSTKISHKYFVNNYDFIFSLFTFLGSMGIIYIYSNILDSVMSTRIKNVLVFGNMNKMPGNTALTKLFYGNYSDFRVSKINLQKFYKNIWKEINQNSQDKLYQNKKWYALYTAVRNENIIFFSNSNYLLTRDISVLSIVFVIFYPLMSKFPYIYYNYKVHIYFIIIWIITTYAAHKTGEKFANNVLVENYIKGENHEHS